MGSKNGGVYLIFRAEIEPVVQKRQRGRYIASKGKHGRVVMYDPEKSREYKKTLGTLLRQQMNGLEPVTYPLEVQIEFILPIPKSWSKKAKEEAVKRVVVPQVQRKGDIDNLVKAAFDAANGVVWLDDSQVIVMSAWKVYGETPAVNMSVVPYKRETILRERADEFGDECS